MAKGLRELSYTTVSQLLAPFPYFGGKRKIARDVWAHFGQPRQYIEPFCGSVAVLLASPAVASLEVINDQNGFIANFWRSVKFQPGNVAIHADYPVSHVDLGARHVWLMKRRAEIAVWRKSWSGISRLMIWRKSWSGISRLSSIG